MTSDKLDVREVMTLLERLRTTVAEFAKREQKMSRAQDVRFSGIAWRTQSSVAGEEDGESQEVTAAETVFNQRAEHIHSVAAHRRDRVKRASAAALRKLPIGAREARGNWLANLQLRLREADHARTIALDAAEREAGMVAAKLTEECKRLILLKRAARQSVSGYRKFRARLTAGNSAPAESTGGREGLGLVEQALNDAERSLHEFRQFLLPKFFQVLPPPLFGVAGILLGAGLAWHWGFNPTGYEIGGGAAVVFLGAFFGLYIASERHVQQIALALVDAVVRADRLYEAVRVGGTHALEAAQAAIQATYEETHAVISEHWKRVDEVEREFHVTGATRLDRMTPRILAKIQDQEMRRAAILASERQLTITRIRDDFAVRREVGAKQHEEDMAKWNVQRDAEWLVMEEQWKAETSAIYSEIDALRAHGNTLFPAWDAGWINDWQPPHDFPTAAQFATIDVDLKTLAGALPQDRRLALPGPAEFSLPLALTFPRLGSLLIQGKEPGTEASGALNALILRLLAAAPPGKVSFTIIDPVGLGQNFAGLMFLADYEESLINRRIWTQQSQIEERLAELNEHIEKVIQMYLRNEYATITEYNEKAGSVAEKYHFLVIADFPAQFSETAARRLQSIATSGPRCGVYTIVQWDQRQNPPEGLAVEELRRGSVVVERRPGGYFLPGLQPEVGTTLKLAYPPEAALVSALVRKTGQASVDSNRVEVPFSQISPAPGELWTHETTQELKIAIGRTGATKPQYLSIGKGTRQHALFAGKTGSGKSTLFHVIITNLALACSPSQVEFYLIDFKKGVEFKCYAEKRLPHARVVAIESDREFALSVLQRVDDELRRRGDLFRKLGVQDVAGYKKASGLELPRSLLIIDEFQEFFVEDDSIAQNASLLFDRIVRQGRAFGIHVLLGSQTLGGAYTLARATLGQMVIRVALQCNEADAYLIMDDNNAAPRLLSRPGEGIYNDAAGAVEGNSPFQVVWLADEERDQLLDQIHTLAIERGTDAAGPIVFEGNAPADVRDNFLLQGLLRNAPAASPDIARAWLGAPNSIKGPTEAAFHRQSGSNLLIVGQRDEVALSMLGLSLVALAAEYPVGAARFIFFQGTADGSGAAFIEQIAKGLPHEISIVTPHDTAAAMAGIAAELKQRIASGASTAAPLFVFVNGLHKFKKLRHEEDFSFSSGGDDAEADPGAQFDELIREGSVNGIHLLITIDAYNNVTRNISRKAISEFEMRVVFQMSANDSASLIDSPQASSLGLHRALFFNEREGTLETFRPYALPNAEWVQEAAAKMHVRAEEKSEAKSANAD